MMGKECEQEAMTDAAIANYEKALRLCPNNPTARKRLEKIKTSLQKNYNKHGKRRIVFQNI